MSAKVLNKEDATKILKVELIANGKGTQAVHDAVVAMRANRRAGTHSTKTKGTVQKSGSKPWRQKGTGRARAGYVASPVWRGGGVAFGPHPRDYSKKVPKKVKKLALKKALSERIKLGDIFLVENFDLKAPKTREFVSWLKVNKVEGTVLLVNNKIDETLLRASRNVATVETTTADLVNTEQMLKYDKILITSDALAKIGERLS